ncbi:MAG: hypothetical protein WA667_02220 [Candidatus Nitrosopolaris sp.]
MVKKIKQSPFVDITSHRTLYGCVKNLNNLNVHQLERQGADIQTKVEELEQLNQSMRDRDKMKDDAIAHLSDQLIALTARIDSIERRQ